MNTVSQLESEISEEKKSIKALVMCQRQAITEYRPPNRDYNPRYNNGNRRDYRTATTRTGEEATEVRRRTNPSSSNANTARKIIGQDNTVQLSPLRRRLKRISQPTNQPAGNCRGVNRRPMGGMRLRRIQRSDVFLSRRQWSRHGPNL